MNRDELKIIVVGATNTGKTTVARLIEESLRANGFRRVEVKDLDPSPNKDHIMARIAATKERKISIEVQQVRAEPETGRVSAASVNLSNRPKTTDE